MAVTRRSSVSSPQRLLVHHHHSSSPSNFTLGLRLYPGNNSNSTDGAVSNRIKRTCLCSPTTHPGSFRCVFHRRLENQKTGTLANNKSSSSNSRKKNGGVNLRKLAIVNSLAKIGTMEAKWLRGSMADTLIREKTLFLERPPDFTPRRSRFYTLYKDQNSS